MRNEDLADSLLKDYDLYGKDVNTFREIFGKENENWFDYDEDDTILTLLYYFDSICNEQGMILSMTCECFCFMICVFKNDKLIDVEYICT